jgi:hypothetical protein
MIRAHNRKNRWDVVVFCAPKRTGWEVVIFCAVRQSIYYLFQMTFEIQNKNWLLGWYVGPGFAAVLPSFALASECSSRSITVASATSSAQLLLRDVRQWSAAPWRGLRLGHHPWVARLPIALV